MVEGGEIKRESPQPPPVSFVVAFELFETLKYCVLPPQHFEALKPTTIYMRYDRRYGLYLCRRGR